MISLPGLTLTTGRPEIARSIIATFAEYINQGMLPNRFPDYGEAPEYNTVDATLWYFEAISNTYCFTDYLEMWLFDEQMKEKRFSTGSWRSIRIPG